MENFINKFKNKSRHHNKLITFIYPELKNIENSNILEFGVSEKAMSTELFLEHSSKKIVNYFQLTMLIILKNSTPKIGSFYTLEMIIFLMCLIIYQPRLNLFC